VKSQTQPAMKLRPTRTKGYFKVSYWPFQIRGFDL